MIKLGTLDMRITGLIIIAGSVAAACSGPAPDVASNAGGGSREEAAAENGGASTEQAELQPAPEAADSANEVQGVRTSPCLTQGADSLQVAPIRAVGTEPFWAARVEGRCVTYSHPEDQQGTRVWTRYSDEGNGRGSWVGQLGGRKFEMRVRPEAGCSDGMSDEIYPMAVDLMVEGEQRHGCAEPL